MKGIPQLSERQIKSFWLKVMVCEVNDCWLWVGSKNERGYGLIYINKSTFKAHRVSYSISIGEIPNGLIVRHKCDNPSCCNPGHLEIGTDLDNARDRVSRGRSRHLKGEENPSSKLSREDITRIRQDQRTQKEIAKDYGVRQQHIQKIKSREIWAHIC